MPNLVKCVICDKLRDADTEFHNNGQTYSDGIKRKRKDCIYCCRKRRSEYFKNPDKKKRINERRREDYANDSGRRKEINRKHALKALYDITPEQYEALKVKQDSKCAICKRPESIVPRKRLYVDHCHITKVVRGLLCATCNSAIGLMSESTETLQKAIEYLKIKKIG